MKLILIRNLMDRVLHLMAVKINQIKGKRRENPIPAESYKKTHEKVIFLDKFCNYEKCDSHFPWMFLITFSERNDLAEVKKTNSNGTIVCDNDAHIVVLCTRCHFLVRASA